MYRCEILPDKRKVGKESQRSQISPPIAEPKNRCAESETCIPAYRPELRACHLVDPAGHVLPRVWRNASPSIDTVDRGEQDLLGYQEMAPWNGNRGALMARTVVAPGLPLDPHLPTWAEYSPPLTDNGLWAHDVLQSSEDEYYIHGLVLTVDARRCRVDPETTILQAQALRLCLSATDGVLNQIHTQNACRLLARNAE